MSPIEAQEYTKWLYPLIGDSTNLRGWIEWSKNYPNEQVAEAGELVVDVVIPKSGKNIDKPEFIKVMGSGLFAYHDSLCSNDDPTGLARLAEPMFTQLPKGVQKLDVYSRHFGMTGVMSREDGNLLLTHERSETSVGVDFDQGTTYASGAVLGALMVLPEKLLKLAKKNGVMIYSGSGNHLPILGVPSLLVKKLRGQELKENEPNTWLNAMTVRENFQDSNHLLVGRACVELVAQRWKPVLVGSYAKAEGK